MKIPKSICKIQKIFVFYGFKIYSKKIVKYSSFEVLQEPDAIFKNKFYLEIDLKGL